MYLIRTNLLPNYSAALQLTKNEVRHCYTPEETQIPVHQHMLWQSVPGTKQQQGYLWLACGNVLSLWLNRYSLSHYQTCQFKQGLAKPEQKRYPRLVCSFSRTGFSTPVLKDAAVSKTSPTVSPVSLTSVTVAHYEVNLFRWICQNWYYLINASWIVSKSCTYIHQSF